MLQLILGISLGIILLFVLLLLVTEVATTYPVWKHVYKKTTPLPEATLPAAANRNKSMLWLLVLALLLLMTLLAYFVGRQVINQEPTVTASENRAAEKNVYTKLLSGSDGPRRYFFRLQTKWQDGKLYGNNQVTFHRDAVLPFSDCRYHLLDKENYLIREILFSPDEFVYTTNAAGDVNGLSNKFNTEISLQEYRKIEKLQVVLDKKIVVP